MPALLDRSVELLTRSRTNTSHGSSSWCGLIVCSVRSYLRHRYQLWYNNWFEKILIDSRFVRTRLNSSYSRIGEYWSLLAAADVAGNSECNCQEPALKFDPRLRAAWQYADQKAMHALWTAMVCRFFVWSTAAADEFLDLFRAQHLDTKFALVHDVAHTGEFVCVYGCRSSLHQSRRGICCRASAPQDDPLKACAHLVALARLIATILKKIRRLIPSERTTGCQNVCFDQWQRNQQHHRLLSRKPATMHLRCPAIFGDSSQSLVDRLTTSTDQELTNPLISMDTKFSVTLYCDKCLDPHQRCFLRTYPPYRPRIPDYQPSFLREENRCHLGDRHTLIRRCFHGKLNLDVLCTRLLKGRRSRNGLVECGVL
ncbi:hypothetical protein KEM48_010035 [Puccinia striiformis f. sp. tritici PST-130]|nr:hypothetical protein KEM48_010035 [Puccinia striiformis f. sp. tritici PST-130]